MSCAALPLVVVAAIVIDRPEQGKNALLPAMPDALVEGGVYGLFLCVMMTRVSALAESGGRR